MKLDSHIGKVVGYGFFNDISSTAVERTLLILEAAAQREGGMSNADFSRKLKIPKSSASYILRTLEQHGYLRRDGEDGRYRLGMKVLNLSRAALGGIDVREVALPDHAAPGRPHPHHYPLGDP